MNDRQREALDLTWHCTEKLRRAGIPVLDIEVRFDLRGTMAGQAHCTPDSNPMIRLNPILLTENDDFVTETIPHEVAHVGVFYWLSRKPRRPHGPEWQRLMHLLGEEPRRCHRYDVSNVLTRRLKRYPYVCGCRSHELTSIRHHRVRRGVRYRCRCCGNVLSEVSGP
ncbi:MAG: SprT-like domain-containing protein [Candidatus Competibacterales bacterium]|nr:SprT-like domain-containing protein [Candidatus Competibacterales bacterium]